MKTGIELITQERERQLAKGWSLDHDKTEHSDGILSDVAAYLITGDDTGTLPEWAYFLYDKIESDYVKRLQISGALLAAEIDRKFTP